MSLTNRSRVVFATVSLLASFLTAAVWAQSSALNDAEGRLGETELAELEETLRATEMAFAASVADKDWERFADFIAEEAIFMSGAVLRGKPAILEAWRVFFQEEAPKLGWQPEFVAVQQSGELGMTRGPYTLEQTGPDGRVVSQSGLFNSIWRHQDDGSWQVVFDLGCPPCQAPESSGGGD